ncbi:GntP family permease, partial [Streptococcus pyogenes]
MNKFEKYYLDKGINNEMIKRGEKRDDKIFTIVPKRGVFRKVLELTGRKKKKEGKE